MKKTILYLMLAGLFVVPASAAYYEITAPSVTSTLTLLTGDMLYMTAGQIGQLDMLGNSTAIVEGTSFGYSGGAVLCLPECFDIRQINMAEVSSLALFGGKVNQLTMTGRATAVLADGNAIRVGQIDMTGYSSLTLSKGQVDRINIGKIPSGEIFITTSRPNAVLSGGMIGQLYAPRPLFESGFLIWDETTQTWVEVEVSNEPAVTIECLNHFYDESTNTLIGRWTDGTAFSIRLIDVENLSYGPTIDNIEFVQPIDADVYLNGGTYTIDDATLENHWVYLSYNSYNDTYVNLVDGGKVGRLAAYGGSTIDMRGGSIGSNLIMQDNARIMMSGGTIGDTIEVSQNGTMYLYGTNFAVTDLNGITTALSVGDKLSDFATLVSQADQPPYYTGTITGALAYGILL